MNHTFYKIICKNTDITDCYVGSTTNMSNRIKNHYYKYKTGLEYKIYCFMRENGGIENFSFVILECKIFQTNEDAYKYEQYLIIEHKSNLNSRSAYITKEMKKNYHKNYYNKNKKQLATYQKNYQKNYKLKKKLSIQNLLHHQNFMRAIIGDAL